MNAAVSLEWTPWGRGRVLCLVFEREGAKFRSDRGACLGWIPLEMRSVLSLSSSSLLYVSLAMLSLILVIVLLLCQHIQAFLSVDSDIVNSYHFNDSVPLVVNKITSEKTKVPFAYGELPFVCPFYDTTRKQQRSLLNLGHILQGDRFMKSNFEVGWKKT